MPKKRRLHSLACKDTLAAAAKQKRRQEDAQQRDSKLALGRLAHSLASNLQISLCCHQSSVMEAQLSERRRRAAIKGALEQRTPPLAGFSASIVISMLLLHITVVYI